MILQIDRGNTRLKWRLRIGSSRLVRGSLMNQDGFNSLLDACSGYVIEQIFIASVMGEESDKEFTAWVASHFDIVPLYAKTTARCAGVVNGYAIPERLGVDRWLAMLGGYARTRSACVIVDCGSALTVDLLDNQGVHRGGYIAPGVDAMRRALFFNTQGVKVEGLTGGSLAPGRDTVSAVSAAQLGMICGLIQQAQHQLSLVGASSSELLLTGGDAPWLATVIETAVVVPDLVLDGLELAFSGK